MGRNVKEKLRKRKRGKRSNWGGKETWKSARPKQELALHRAINLDITLIKIFAEGSFKAGGIVNWILKRCMSQYFVQKSVVAGNSPTSVEYDEKFTFSAPHGPSACMWIDSVTGYFLSALITYYSRVQCWVSQWTDSRYCSWGVCNGFLSTQMTRKYDTALGSVDYIFGCCVLHASVMHPNFQIKT